MIYQNILRLIRTSFSINEVNIYLQQHAADNFNIVLKAVITMLANNKADKASY